MEKAYKFRIYPTKEQEILIQKTFGCVRYVYNHYLAMRKEAYEKDKTTIYFYACNLDLTKLKKENEWLQEPDKHALQNSLRNLERSFNNFFRGCKSGIKIGYPKFKSKKDRHKSYRTNLNNNNITLTNKAIKLPKLGLVECRVSKQIQGRILSVNVSQNPSGKYFAAVCCTDVEIQPFEKTGAIVGIDLGIKDFAVTSDGQKFENHRYLAKSQKKLAKLQRSLSRKQSGSANQNKARIKVARCYERIANQRNDALHKLSTQLANIYDLIVVEDLQVEDMVRNQRLANSISDVSWSEFVRQLKYKCEWYGKSLVRIDKFFPSSQLCNTCGNRNTETKNLSVREWTCNQCDTAHDRDVNAAKNILDEGLRILSAA